MYKLPRRPRDHPGTQKDGPPMQEERVGLAASSSTQGDAVGAM